MSYKPFSYDRSLEDQVKWAVDTLGYLDTIDVSQRVNRILKREEATAVNVQQVTDDITKILGGEGEISDEQVSKAIDMLVSYDHSFQYNREGYKLGENEKEYAKTTFFEKVRVDEDTLTKYLKHFKNPQAKGAVDKIIKAASQSSESRLYEFCMAQLSGAGYLRGKCMEDIRKAYGLSEEELPWYASSMEEIGQAIHTRNEAKNREYMMTYPPEEQVAQDRQTGKIVEDIHKENEERLSQIEREKGIQLPPEVRRQWMARENERRQREEFVRRGIIPPQAQQPGPQQPQPGMMPGAQPMPMGGGPAAAPQPQPPPGG